MSLSLILRPRHVFLVCLLVGTASNAFGQDIFRQVDDLRNQVEALRREVAALRVKVDNAPVELRKLRAQGLQRSEQAGSRSLLPGTTPAPDKPLDKEALKAVVCEPLRKFVAEADETLESGDVANVQARMDRARSVLRASLQQYSQDQDVQRILGIADATAWDTASAVQLRDSVEGNREFLESLAQYKRRFTYFCGEK